MFSVFRASSVALAVALLTGCESPAVSTEEPTTEAIEMPAEGEVEVKAQEGKRLVSFESETNNRLWDQANKAVDEGRLWAPAGNNAVEYYLQIRQSLASSGNQEIGKRAVDAALSDFTPLLALAIDEAIETRQLQEASRLIRMLAAIDSQHPALNRQIEQVRRIATNN